ncbi:MAG: hypothetical protein JNL30_06940 [Rubrivivax sp.]|nr:hypothetical protein [Rubrivivax sp.]
MSYRHRTLAGAIFLALAATALPSQAQGQPGARCPVDSLAADYTSNYSNLILRCQSRARVPPVCLLPMYPTYEVRQGADQCKPNAPVPPAPGTPLTVAATCPPNFTMQIDVDPQDRDRCRSNTTTNVPPVLGIY